MSNLEEPEEETSGVYNILSWEMQTRPADYIREVEIEIRQSMGRELLGIFEKHDIGNFVLEITREVCKVDE